MKLMREALDELRERNPPSGAWYQRITTKAQAHHSPKPTLEVIYRDQSGEINRKFLPWLRPQTDEAVAEYMDDYFERVAGGYQPEGYETPPLPHCARVKLLGRIVAEWILSPTFPTESLVTVGKRVGSGGIPTVVLSAPCLERLAVPKLPDPRGIHPDSVSISSDPSNVARLGQATLTTG